MSFMNAFAGNKCRHIFNYSEVERDYAISLEWNTEVLKYFPAQMEIEVETNPLKFIKIHFWVKYKNGIERLVYIHPGTFNARWWDTACRNTINVCATFTPVSATLVRKEPRRSNLELLWDHADEELRMEYIVLLNEFFRKTKIPNLGKLQDYFAQRTLNKNLVYTLIFHKALICNVENFKLEKNSPVLMNPNLDPGAEWKTEIFEEMSFF